MSFSDLFDSEFKQRNKGHFLLVSISRRVFAPEEKEF
jgi:hypothetical protein